MFQRLTLTVIFEISPRKKISRERETLAAAQHHRREEGRQASEDMEC